MFKKRNQTKRRLSWLFFGLITLFFASTVAQAESSFYVQPVMPENQLDQTTEYFNLSVPTLIDQELSFTITNEGTEAKKLQLLALDAMTLKEGTISYSLEHQYDESQRYKLSDMVVFEQNQVTVEPKSTLTVNFNLKQETTKFYGTILGAINISEAQEANEKVALSNSFAYNIPVKARVIEDDMESLLNFNELDLITETVDPTLQLEFQNPQAAIIKELTLSYDVYKKDDQKKVLWSDKVTQLEVSPNSLFVPEVSLLASHLKAGNYVIKMTANAGDFKKSWESDFTLSNASKKAMNEGLDIFSGGRSWQEILMIVLTVIVIALALIFIGGVILAYYKKQK